jgi:hypothetical protein
MAGAKAMSFTNTEACGFVNNRENDPPACDIPGFEEALSRVKKIAALLLSIVLLMAIGNPPIAFAADCAKSAAGSSSGAKQVAETGAPATHTDPCQTSASTPVSEMDRLLAILVQKHLLSSDEAASVRAEVKKEDQEPIASDSSSSQPQAVASSEGNASQPTAAVQDSTLRERTEGGTEKLPFKISGFGQVQWSSTPGSGSSFQLRRGRIAIDGDIHKLASYKIQVETLNMPALLDAYLQLKPAPYARITFGQFKIPFSQENLRSSSDLFTIERSQVVNGLVPGRDNGSNGRDIGADFGGSFNITGSAGVDYAVGMFNGAGINRRDDNNRKDLAVRLALRPFRGLILAGDYYKGAAGSTEVARDRQGAEIAYSYLPLTLMGEFIWGRDGAIRKQGWYGLAAWRFTKRWEGVFRADGFDPDRSLAQNTSNAYVGGLNWYFATGLKWQFNEGLQNKQSQVRNLLLSQLQFQF